MRTTPASVYALALDAHDPPPLLPSHVSLAFATVAASLLGGAGVTAVAGHGAGSFVVVALFAGVVVAPALGFLHARRSMFFGALASGTLVSPLAAAVLIAGPQLWAIAPLVAVGLGTPPAARAIEEVEGRAVWWVAAAIGFVGACGVCLFA